MLLEIKLDESKEGAAKVPSKVQVIRAGKWRYGSDDLNISTETLQSFKRNFDNKVRGYDDGKIPFDYYHNSWAEAAGWIGSLELRENDTQLWADVEWTPRAASMIASKEIRYVSAEFHLEYKDDETQQEYGPTLFGAGLTNRPFVKNMAPLTLDDKKKQERVRMDLEQAKSKITELEQSLNELKTAKAAADQELADLKTKHLEVVANAALAEKKAKFDKLLLDGKVVEAQREAFMSDDMVKFSELSKPVNPGKGTAEDVTAPAGKAQEQILKLASEQKKTIREVLEENPELRKQYESEVKI